MSSKRSNLTAYRGHILSPLDRAGFEEHLDGVLLVDQNGVIEFVGNWRDALATYGEPIQTYDYGKRLIVPGFIDLHVHLVQIAQTGRSGDTLLGWLKKYIFTAETKFASPSHATKMADWFFRELARNGTTLASVFTSIHKEATRIAFETAARQGSRVIMGKVLMDRNAPDELTEDTAKSLADSEELAEQWHGHDGGRLLYAFTPRFAPTSTAAQLQGAAQLWKKFPGSYMQTHVSENVDEIAWVKDLYPDSRHYLDAYASHGLIGSNSIFAHAIHLSDDELAQMHNHKACIAHCPSSNLFLKSGRFPYARVLDAGVKFGLGSDVAAGPEMSIFKVMKDAAYVQTELWLSPRELFYLGTLAGAEAVNLDDRIGSLKAGKEADFVVIDPTLKSSVPFDILDQPADDILSSLIYVGDDRMVVATYVRGRRIYELPEVHDSERRRLSLLGEHKP